MVGAEFAALRKSFSMTQKTLAREMEIGRRTVIVLEKSRRDIPIVYRLAMERISLSIAASNRDPSFAMLSVRDDDGMFFATTGADMKTIGDALAAGFTKLVTFWSDEDGGTTRVVPLPRHQDQAEVDLIDWSKSDRPDDIRDALVGAALSKAEPHEATDMAETTMIWGRHRDEA